MSELIRFEITPKKPEKKEYSRRAFLGTTAAALAALGTGYGMKEMLASPDTPADKKTEPSVPPEPDNQRGDVESPLNRRKALERFLSIESLQAQATLYIAKAAERDGKNLLVDILSDRNPESNTNLMASMMISEEANNPVIAGLVGYTVLNRMRVSGLSLQDVIYGEGNRTRGTQTRLIGTKYKRTPPYSTERDIISTDSGTLSPFLKQDPKVYDLEAFYKAPQITRKEGVIPISTFETARDTILANPSLLYRVIARMIFDPDQPLEKYNLLQSYFLHPGAQDELSRVHAFVRPVWEKEKEYRRLGLVKLDIPLINAIGPRHKDYVSFYIHTYKEGEKFRQPSFRIEHQRALEQVGEFIDPTWLTDEDKVYLASLQKPAV